MAAFDRMDVTTGNKDPKPKKMKHKKKKAKAKPKANKPSKPRKKAMGPMVKQRRMGSFTDDPMSAWHGGTTQRQLGMKEPWDKQLTTTEDEDHCTTFCVQCYDTD